MIRRRYVKKKRKDPRRDGRVRSSEHRAWVRQHACIVPFCNSESRIDPAHVRSSGDGGMSMKPDDRFCIALCRDHHREQHQIGEPAFERKYNVNLLDAANEFAALSPPLKRALNDTSPQSTTLRDFRAQRTRG